MTKKSDYILLLSGNIEKNKAYLKLPITIYLVQ